MLDRPLQTLRYSTVASGGTLTDASSQDSMNTQGWVDQNGPYFAPSSIDSYAVRLYYDPALVVPEPFTGVLMVVGLGLVFSAARDRRRRVSRVA